MPGLIQVTNLSKVYLLTNERRRSVKSMVLDVARGRRPERPKEYIIMHDLSFGVEPGQVIGILGENGTGKSTLLKILAGILNPTSGEVHVSGRVAALLEIGLGFNPELTGRENALLYGSILGLPNRLINERLSDIVAFAELEDFVDMPMRKYSSGMQMRLAFSVAMNVDPDILLLDEVFSVGDQRFQKKSFARLESIISMNKAVVLVSHDMNVIRRLCNMALFMRRGGGAFLGEPEEAISLYMSGLS